MVALARRKLLGQGRRAVYHCWTRCVRRAFLCGRDPLTDRDFSHRRDWILTREEQLARLFAIEVEFHAELSNHLHLMLRTRPDIARRWSRQEVARRWLTITRIAKCMFDGMPQVKEQRIEQLARDKKKIQKLRGRLSSISWLMAILCENIARRANQEDECRGRFFETRFKCRECTDPSGMLLCALYVETNRTTLRPVDHRLRGKESRMIVDLRSTHIGCERRKLRSIRPPWLPRRAEVRHRKRSARLVLTGNAPGSSLGPKKIR